MTTKNALLLSLAAGAWSAGCGEGEPSSSPSSPSLATEIMEARIAATNTQDWDAWEALHAADACRTAPELEEPLCGSAAMRAAIEGLVVAFPDYRLELVDVVEVGDRFAARMHTRGTMDGPLLIGDDLEIPPTGRAIEQDWVALVRVEDGLIVQFDEFYDQYTLLVQLGLMPAF